MSFSILSNNLRLDSEERIDLWHQTVDAIERYVVNVDELPVQVLPEPSVLRERLQAFDFSTPIEPSVALQLVTDSMRSMQTHVSHRRYFGLFNPAPASVGILGEALTAAFNPNVAAWSHSPFAVAAEEHVGCAIGSRFGEAFKWGTFTSGGGEANLTAFLCALTYRYPSYLKDGLRGLDREPVAYVSAASHHSLVKAARSCGLGSGALRVVPCDETLGMDLAQLRSAIAQDRAAGREPFVVVGTAGATATGIIERLEDIAQIATREHMWFHVDAAWGGLAAFVPELSSELRGIADADSITFDPHKSLSVPMGAGLFLTRHPNILAHTFAVTEDYMPPKTDEGERLDPYVHSLQWSRRFAGLKVLLSLSVAGWDGYANALRHQTEMGNLLREQLHAAGFTVVNDTPLPLVCFLREDATFNAAETAERAVQSGRVWISPTRLPDGRSVLRAAITNYLTEPSDIAALVAEVVNSAQA